MKCDSCDQVATVFFTQMTGGEITKIKFCDACAKKQNITDASGFSLTEMLFTDTLPTAEKMKSVADFLVGASTCPGCGFKREDFKRVRRMGCSQCYQTFSQEVKAVLSGMHKGTAHVGKIPLLKRKTQQTKTLTAKMEAAISAERYEDAARLRDEIRKLSDN